MTVLELLDREILKLEAALEYATVKPNVKEDEIVNIQTKLDLKREIRDIVRRSLAV